MAVVGQAKGVSSGGDNHYFALDATDPEAMVPLWEFSDTLENRGAACLGARTRVEAVCEENPTCNDSCNQADRVFDQQLGSNLGDVVMINAYQSLVSTNWDSRSESGRRTLHQVQIATFAICLLGAESQVSIRPYRKGCLFSEYRFNIYQPSEGGFSVYVRAKPTSCKSRWILSRL